MFLQTVYNTCTHSVFTTEILRKSDVSGWCHFEIGVVPLNSIHVIIEYVNSNTHALLDCITVQLQETTHHLHRRLCWQEMAADAWDFTFCRQQLFLLDRTCFRLGGVRTLFS